MIPSPFNDQSFWKLGIKHIEVIPEENRVLAWNMLKIVENIEVEALKLASNHVYKDIGKLGFLIIVALAAFNEKEENRLDEFFDIASKWARSNAKKNEQSI